MNRPTNQVRKSNLESGAVNRSHRLFSLQELPAALSTCVHYHEKEGNSMPMSSSQWVGISSLVTGNSIVSLPASISKVAIMYYSQSIFISSQKILRCWTGLRPGELVGWIFIKYSSFLCFCANESAHAAPSVPPSPKQPSLFLISRFQIQGGSLPQPGWAGGLSLLPLF